MSASMPWSLLVAWFLFAAFGNCHLRHAVNFRGSSASFLAALHISSLLSFVVAIGLLIYYFVQVAWYWPLALLALSVTVGALLAVLAEVLIGSLWVSLAGFVGWPAAAIWAGMIIHGLGKPAGM